MHPVPSPSPRRALRPALAALLAALAAGCATTKPQKEVVWPEPPDTARIRWVRTFAIEDDLGLGAARTLGRIFVPSDTAAGIAQPTGVAVSPDDRYLYVSCNAARTVLQVDLVERKMRNLVTGDKRPGGAFGVAVDGEGNVYVSDHGKGVVWVYSPEGKHLRTFGDGKLDRATGIAIDRRRQLVYVTAGANVSERNHRVEVFSTKGEHIRTIGTRGSTPGKFNFPTYLAVGPDGTLYVADMLNFRIQMFDPDGEVLGTYGTLGAGRPGAFDKVKGVALDTFGNVYAVDSAIGIIQIFNRKMQPLMAFAGRGDTPGLLHVPNAIAISGKNTIYVADFAQDAIVEYQLVNTTAADSEDQETPTRSPGEKPQAGG